MSRSIQILPDSVANQIAAGEVVERPASVVKELVENALDAGATHLEIRIRNGGKRLIQVSDDGSGMGREDAIVSLDRHATSKIGRAEDLRGVATFGFRGEALPSIASVSRFTLESRSGRDDVGTRVRVRGGTILGVDEVARTAGTTITVENLFFNAPARSKFLGAPSVEARAVSESLTPLALAHPGVAMTLLSDDKTLLDLPPASGLLERIACLWGEEAAHRLLAVDFRDGAMSVRGVVERPDATRRGFRRTHLFVCDRPFREAALLAAADRGYRTTIPPDHRPWIILFLDTPREGVDVNVHPTKAEVRFRDRAGIEALVEKAIRSALETEGSAATFDRVPEGGHLPVREPDPLPGGGGGVGPDLPSPDGEDGRRNGPADRESQMALFLAGGEAPGEPGAERDAEAASGTAGPVTEPGIEAAASTSSGLPRLWQVHRSWIMAEVRDGLLLIDQHAAHERVLFEQIMARFQDEGEASQRLLFPLTVRLAPAEYLMVDDLKGLLHKAGFEVEGFGGDTVIVHAVPHPHPYFDSEGCFREMIDELTNGSELMRSARNQHERVAMSFACKAAIKAGQALDDREIHELFDQLFATELPYHDVHGRPTTVRLSRGELERKFGR